MLDDEVLAAARRVLAACRIRDLKVATAESCTGGLIIAALTEIAGSSDVVERGIVSYSNEAKSEMLGVPRPLILRHGAVSEEVAKAMAEGALDRSTADIAVAVTGIAGPGGGSPDRPVGLVHLACAAKAQVARHAERRFGDVGRAEVRRLTVLAALALLEEAAMTTSAGTA